MEKNLVGKYISKNRTLSFKIGCILFLTMNKQFSVFSQIKPNINIVLLIEPEWQFSFPNKFFPFWISVHDYYKSFYRIFLGRKKIMSAHCLTYAAITN